MRKYHVIIVTIVVVVVVAAAIIAIIIITGYRRLRAGRGSASRLESSCVHIVEQFVEKNEVAVKCNNNLSADFDDFEMLLKHTHRLSYLLTWTSLSLVVVVSLCSSWSLSNGSAAS